MKTTLKTLVLSAFGAYLGITGCVKPTEFELRAINAQKAVSTAAQAIAFQSNWEKIPDLKNEDDWRSLAYSLEKGSNDLEEQAVEKEAKEERGGGDCDDYVVASIAVLIDDGYPPFVLVTRNQADRGDRAPFLNYFCTREKHLVHLLAKDDKFGINGMHDEDKILPTYSTVEELLANWYYITSADLKGEYLIVVPTHLDGILTATHNLFKELNSDVYQTPWMPIDGAIKPYLPNEEIFALKPLSNN